MKKVDVELLLRIAVFGTFLGHGLVAIGVNIQWLPFLTTVGFSLEQARELMPVIGAIDLVIAAWILIKPNKYVLIYAVFWTFLTALMRPLSGGSWLAFVERTANWATPLALLFLNQRRIQN